MRKKLLFLALLLLIGIIGAGSYFFQVKKDAKTLSDKEIFNMFSCGRASLDIAATDVYCASPERYREDAKNNHVITSQYTR